MSWPWPARRRSNVNLQHSIAVLATVLVSLLDSLNIGASTSCYCPYLPGRQLTPCRVDIGCGDRDTSVLKQARHPQDMDTKKVYIQKQAYQESRSPVDM